MPSDPLSIFEGETDLRHMLTCHGYLGPRIEGQSRAMNRTPDFLGSQKPFESPDLRRRGGRGGSQRVSIVPGDLGDHTRWSRPTPPSGLAIFVATVVCHPPRRPYVFSSQ